jgi:hypothetical protein
MSHQLSNQQSFHWRALHTFKFVGAIQLGVHCAGAHNILSLSLSVI